MVSKSDKFASIIKTNINLIINNEAKAIKTIKKNINKNF
jgi:hypothetical protein